MGLDFREDGGTDDATSTFGDSSYDFVDERSVTATDDESHGDLTDSLASLTRGGSEVDEDAFDPKCVLQRGSSADDDKVPSYAILNEPDEKHGHIGEELPCIKLRELAPEQRHRPDRILVSHTLTHMPHLPGYEDTWDVSIRQCMHANTIPLRSRPFKLLYFGNVTHRDEIIHHIARALSTSDAAPDPILLHPRPSKFSIVRVSSDETPEIVLVDSAGFMLEVEDISAISTEARRSSHSTSSAMLKGEAYLASTQNGHEARLPASWSVPDLAILYMTGEEDSHQSREQDLLRSFTRRHNIPLLLLTEELLPEERVDQSSINPALPHFHLEQKESSSGQDAKSHRRPIDLAHFFRLDAIQLNRSLACVTPSESSPDGEWLGRHEDCGVSLTQNLKRLRGRRGAWWTSTNGKAPIILLAILAILALASLYAPLKPHDRSGGVVSKEQKSNMAGKDAPSLTVFQSTQEALLARSSKNRTASSGKGPPSLPRRPFAYSKTGSLDSVKAQVLGSRHVVIETPELLETAYKSHEVQISLWRHTSQIEHSIFQVSEHVYALEIPLEESYGLLSLNVRTKTPPTLDETIHLDFGQARSSLGNWSKSIQIQMAKFKLSLHHLCQDFIMDNSQKFPADQAWRMVDYVSWHAQNFGARLDAVAKELRHSFVTQLDTSVHFRSMLRSIKFNLGNWKLNFHELTSVPSLRSLQGKILTQYRKELKVAQKMALKVCWRVQRSMLRQVEMFR